MKCPHCGGVIRIDDIRGHYAKRKARPTANQRNPGGRRSVRRRLLEYIVLAGPAGRTDDESIVGLNVAHQSLANRRLELEEGRWIAETPMRRKTRTGKDAIVWIATEAGIRFVRAPGLPGIDD